MKHFNLKITLILFLLIAVSCNNETKKNQTFVADSSPYDVFFKQLKIDHLTDTILVQNQTKIFGCGTGHMMYYDELAKNGLYKFYDKYETVLDSEEHISLFERNNKVKILWISRGNEGELFQLYDSTLHANQKLEKRLIAEKTFLMFDENPTAMDSVNITVMINYHSKVILKSFDLSKNEGQWRIDKQDETETKADF